MAKTLTRDGRTIHVAWTTPWYGRLIALPLLAASAYLFHFVLLGLTNDVQYPSQWRDDLAGLLVFSALGLAVGLPGLIAATFRYSVVIDAAAGHVTAVRQFGPLAFRRARDLAAFKFVSITDDGDTRATSFAGNLCGDKRTVPLVLCGSRDRKAITDLPNEIGTELKLPVMDVVDTEPDDADANDQQDATAAIAPVKSRDSGAADRARRSTAPTSRSTRSVRAR